MDQHDPDVDALLGGSDLLSVQDVVILLGADEFTVLRWVNRDRVGHTEPFPSSAVVDGHGERRRRRDEVAGWVERRWPGRLVEAGLSPRGVPLPQPARVPPVDVRLWQQREQDSERALLQLIGVLELAERLDVAVERLELCTRGRCRQRYCGPFPAPALVIAGTRGWYRDEVQAWLQHSSCAGGQPPQRRAAAWSGPPPGPPRGAVAAR